MSLKSRKVSAANTRRASSTLENDKFRIFNEMVEQYNEDSLKVRGVIGKWAELDPLFVVDPQTQIYLDIYTNTFSFCIENSFPIDIVAIILPQTKEFLSKLSRGEIEKANLRNTIISLMASIVNEDALQKIVEYLYDYFYPTWSLYTKVLEVDTETGSHVFNPQQPKEKETVYYTTLKEDYLNRKLSTANMHPIPYSKEELKNPEVIDLLLKAKESIIESIETAYIQHWQEREEDFDEYVEHTRNVLNGDGNTARKKKKPKR
ncbi:hypothetical protein PCE1_003091 [Barthelona sp. PCE]